MEETRGHTEMRGNTRGGKERIAACIPVVSWIALLSSYKAVKGQDEYGPCLRCKDRISETHADS